MARNKPIKQSNEQGKRSDKKTASKMLLPGSGKRIEKALTFPTTGRRNPFLDRYQAPAKPASETPPKPASNQSAKPKE